MLTLFSIPKAFTGHIAIIQRNAVQSWLRLRTETGDSAEVILCGDDPGVAEIAIEFPAIRHIPNIARNEYGTPLLSSAFERVQRIAQYPTICYVNGDIIFFPDLLRAIGRIPFPRYLMVGQRHDLDIAAPLEFTAPDWEARLRADVAARGRLQRFDYIDYFVFTRNAVGALPEFAVGRPGWDNWLIYRARALGLPVIDATPGVLAVHQNHDYRHVPQSTGAAWEGPEADRNRALMGGKQHRFYVHDATYKLTDSGVVKALDDVYLERRASRQAALDPRTAPLVRLKHRAIGWVGRRRRIFPGWLWRMLIDRLAR